MGKPYGKAALTAFGVLLGSVGAALQPLPEPLPFYGKVFVVVGTIVVFAAQALFEAGLIPEAPRKRR